MSTPPYTSNRSYRRHLGEKKEEEWKVSPGLRREFQEIILLSARRDCFARSQLSALLTIVERAETKLKEQIIAKDPQVMYALENAKAISRELHNVRFCPTEKDIIIAAIDGVGEILARAQSLVALRVYPNAHERKTDENTTICPDENDPKNFSVFSSALDTIKKNPDRDLNICSFVTTSTGPFSRIAPVLPVPYTPTVDVCSDSSDDEPYEFQHCKEEDYQAFLANCEKNKPLGGHPDLYTSIDLAKTIGKR